MAQDRNRPFERVVNVLAALILLALLAFVLVTCIITTGARL